MQENPLHAALKGDEPHGDGDRSGSEEPGSSDDDDAGRTDEEGSEEAGSGSD